MHIYVITISEVPERHFPGQDHIWRDVVFFCFFFRVLIIVQFRAVCIIAVFSAIGGKIGINPS